MEPIRVKYYGMMWITRQKYLILQSLALSLSLGLLMVGFFAVLLTGSLLPPKQGDLLADALIIGFWIGLLALPAESIEMYVMLRKYAKAEAERQAQLAVLDAGDMAPSLPSSTGVQLPSSKQPNTNIQP